MKRIPTAALLAALLCAGPGAGAAPDAEAQRRTPDWMSTYLDAGRVEFDVVAGWSARNGSWNYNGYADGEITVVVPLHWQVRIAFRNQDAVVPHSLVVTPDYTAGGGRLPDEAGREQTAFARAYTRDPTRGTSSRARPETLAFTAEETGDYLWLCGVPGHARSAMWVRFHVREVAAPYVLVPPGVEGRP